MDRIKTPHLTTAESWKGWGCGIEGIGSEKKPQSLKISLMSTALLYAFYMLQVLYMLEKFYLFGIIKKGL